MKMHFLKILNLKYYDKSVKIYVDFSNVEHSFCANNCKYIADVFIWFHKSEPMDFFYKWNGLLCVEVVNTHKTEAKKISDCEIEKSPIFECKISPKMKKDIINSSEEYIEYKTFVKNYLAKCIFGKFISNPTSVFYAEHLKNKQTIHNLKSENSLLIEETECKNKEIQTFALIEEKLKNENDFLNNSLSKTNKKNIKLQKYEKFVEENKFINFIYKNTVKKGT